MFWLVIVAIVMGILVGLRFKAPAIIAGSAVVVLVAVIADLAWWSCLLSLMALQASYLITVLRFSRR